jgi:hypothetical protein
LQACCPAVDLWHKAYFYVHHDYADYVKGEQDLNLCGGKDEEDGSVGMTHSFTML